MHPYTMGLMRCLPDVDAPKGTRTLHPIPGRVLLRPTCPTGASLPALRAGYLPVFGGASRADRNRARHQVRCLRRAKDWEEVKRLWAVAETKSSAPKAVERELSTQEPC